MNITRHPTTITAQPGTPYLEVSRELDATPERVFRAVTDPELVVRWLGPRNCEMRIQQWDARTGGGYQYTHSGCGGGDDFVAGFRGVFHSVNEGIALVQTFEFDGAPGEVKLDFLTLEDLGGGRCRYVTRSVFSSVEARDAAVASGMEYGIRESFERLDELLAA